MGVAAAIAVIAGSPAFSYAVTKVYIRSEVLFMLAYVGGLAVAVLGPVVGMILLSEALRGAA